MSVAIEPNNLGDLLKYETSNLYSREAVDVASGQNLKLGTVVGRVTETGLVKQFDPLATDGTEGIIGVLLEDCDASSGSKKALMLTREAILADHAVIWPSLTEEQETAAIAQLESRGIIIRKGV